MKIIFDISLCPTSIIRQDGSFLKPREVLEMIRSTAEKNYPGYDVQFNTLQFGYHQGDEWAKCWIDGQQDNELAEDLLSDCEWDSLEIYG